MRCQFAREPCLDRCDDADREAPLTHGRAEERYNEERAHQGNRRQGRTPMQTFLDSKRGFPAD